MKQRVLIAGGGIAGMAAAWWLERAGAQVTIVERAHAFRPLGHYITLKGHGVDVVRRMGLLEACRERELLVRGLAAHTPSGHKLRDANTDLLAHSVAGIILFRRADLHAALYAAVREHTDVRFGTEVQAVRECGQHVEVELASGTERVDLFVGADGIHSHARRLLFGAGGMKALHGRYLAVTVEYPHGLPPGALSIYLGRGQVVALVPRNEQELSALIYSVSRGEETERSDSAALRERLLAQHSHFAQPVLRTLAALNDRTWAFTDEIAMIALPSITRGHSALLGDAAHCPTFLSGMGASLALQGAQALGRAVYDHHGDVTAALATYERAITPLARSYQRSAMRARMLLLTRNPLLVGARNALVEWTPDWALGMSTRRFYRASQLV